MIQTTLNIDHNLRIQEKIPNKLINDDEDYNKKTAIGDGGDVLRHQCVGAAEDNTI